MSNHDGERVGESVVLLAVLLLLAAGYGAYQLGKLASRNAYRIRLPQVLPLWLLLGTTLAAALAAGITHNPLFVLLTLVSGAASVFVARVCELRWGVPRIEREPNFFADLREDVFGQR